MCDLLELDQSGREMLSAGGSVKMAIVVMYCGGVTRSRGSHLETNGK